MITVLIGFLVLIGLFFVFARFTIVDEGTAKAVMRFGEFSYIIFRWQDHWIDEQWTVWRDGEGRDSLPAEPPAGIFPLRIFGGLYLYGIWPVHTIHSYNHRWTDLRIDQEGKVVIKFHEELLSHVLLRPAVYVVRLFDVETSPKAQERIPVTVLILTTIKIINPYRFLFVAPPTPIEDVLARIGAEVRPILTGQSLDDLLLLKGASLWASDEAGPLLKDAKIITDTMPKWGMEVADKGVEIRDIDPPPDYQKALAARRQQQLLAAARAEEIRGTLISAVARSDGRSEDQVQAEFSEDPKGFLEKHVLTREDVMTKLSMEARSYIKGEFPQGTSLETLIALWQRMPGGAAPTGGGEPSRERKAGRWPALEEEAKRK